MSAGCRIRKDFIRPDRKLVEKLRGTPVANIDDNMGRIAAVDSCIYPLNPNVRLLGTAFTVNSPAGDNLLFHKALDMAKPGDVIVLANKGTLDRSVCGEIMSNYAKARGLAGIIIDGCVRDSYALSRFDFPVYAKGVTPNGPYKNGPGEMNFPVSFAGVVINPGDIIVGDADGLLVLRPEMVTDAFIEKLHAYHASEEAQMKGILERCSWERPWVDDLLDEVGFEIID